MSCREAVDVALLGGLGYHRDGKPRRVTLGKPGAMTADRARATALALLAREKGGGKPLPPPPSGSTLAKFAAEFVERRSPAWKPLTRESIGSYLDSAILPVLGELRVITDTSRQREVRGGGQT